MGTGFVQNPLPAVFPSYRHHCNEPCNQESQNLPQEKFIPQQKSENQKVVGTTWKCTWLPNYVLVMNRIDLQSLEDA